MIIRSQKKDAKKKDTKKEDKPDTKKKDTKKEDKPDNKPDTKKRDTKPDTKKEDKPDNIEKHNNAKPLTFRVIKKIINRFICEKFMNEKYEKIDKDTIVFYSICKPMERFKITYMIEISKDMITLAINKETKTMNECIGICMIDNRIKWNMTQKENQKKMDISITIYDNETICNISSISNEHRKNINEKTICVNKIRCINEHHALYY